VAQPNLTQIDTPLSPYRSRAATTLGCRKESPTRPVGGACSCPEAAVSCSA
jgi:hypothetical protein